MMRNEARMVTMRSRFEIYNLFALIFNFVCLCSAKTRITLLIWN